MSDSEIHTSKSVNEPQADKDRANNNAATSVIEVQGEEGQAVQVQQETLEAEVARVVEEMRRRHLSVSWGDRLLTLDKSAAFLDDPVFKQAYQKIYGSHKYDQYDGADTIAWRLNTLCWAARRGLQVGGSFVECGVFKGDMAWLVMQVVGANNIPHFYLYDSFAGMSPELSAPDDFPLNPGFLDFANNFYKDPSVYEHVKNRFSSISNATIIKGFLPDTLDEICPEEIGFMHIDLNSPKAEAAVLDRLFDKVLPGGAIVFDDYGWKLFSEQKITADTFMAKRGHEVLELPTGQGLVIKMPS